MKGVKVYMKRVKSETLKKEFKKIKNNLVIGIICIVLSILCFFLIGFNESRPPKDTIHLNTAIVDKNNETDIKVNVKITTIPYKFAEYKNETDKAFYMIFDGTYNYIAYMSNKNFDELNKEDIKDKHKTIYGISKKIDSNIKSLALEAINEGVDKDKQISSSEFEDYFGGIYIDATENISNVYTTIFAILLVLTAISAWAFIIVYIIRTTQTNNLLKKIDDDELKKIEEEIDSKDAFHYEKAHLILTKNYIISFTGKLYIVKYEDLIWMYEHKLKQYGFTTVKSLMATNNLGKTKAIVQVDGVTKKSSSILNEVADTIYEKNPKILVGYTKENRNAVKEIVKNKK